MNMDYVKAFEMDRRPMKTMQISMASSQR